MVAEILSRLTVLDFTGKGEAFVEAQFLTPLLSCLGYETHKDYEVCRHGDHGSSFKLHYPPVEKGAKKIKHYNPDYLPMIRKKMFWVVEAKSPKDTAYPFDESYITQGLQYCIHPEIQAKYLLVTSGAHSAVYDAHGSVFLGSDPYNPVFEFSNAEIVSRWSEIYDLLSVETLRGRIEADIKAMYDKLCTSSLNENYPGMLLQRIGRSAGEHRQTIEKRVRSLYLESIDKGLEDNQRIFLSMGTEDLFAMMADQPLGMGHRPVSYFFVNKSLEAGVSARNLFDCLTHDFRRQRIFFQLQAWFGLTLLYRRTDDANVRQDCREFWDLHKDADLSLLAQLECARLRVVRKTLVIDHYPQLRERISRQMGSMPELARFVCPPTALSETYLFELESSRRAFPDIKDKPDDWLGRELEALQAYEATIEEAFRTARSRLTDSEKDLGGFEQYGLGGKHYAFLGMLKNCCLEPTEPGYIP